MDVPKCTRCKATLPYGYQSRYCRTCKGKNLVDTIIKGPEIDPNVPLRYPPHPKDYSPSDYPALRKAIFERNKLVWKARDLRQKVKDNKDMYMQHIEDSDTTLYKLYLGYHNKYRQELHDLEGVWKNWKEVQLMVISDDKGRGWIQWVDVKRMQIENWSDPMAELDLVNQRYLELVIPAEGQGVVEGEEDRKGKGKEKGSGGGGGGGNSGGSGNGGGKKR